MMNEAKCKVTPQGEETYSPNGYPVAARRYQVTNQANGHRYCVRLWDENGKLFGACCCKAGSLNRKCRHAVASAVVDRAVSSMRSH